MTVTFIDPVAAYNADNATDYVGDWWDFLTYIPSLGHVWYAMSSSTVDEAILRVDMATREYVGSVITVPSGLTEMPYRLVFDQWRDAVYAWTPSAGYNQQRGAAAWDDDGTHRWTFVSDSADLTVIWYRLELITPGPDAVYALRFTFQIGFATNWSNLHIVSVDPDTGATTNLYEITTGYSGYMLTGSFVDADGCFWFGHSHNVYKFDPVAVSLTAVYTSTGGDDATRLFYDADSERVLWYVQNSSTYGDITIYDIATSSVVDTVTLDEQRRDVVYDLADFLDSYGGFVGSDELTEQSSIFVTDADFVVTQVIPLLPMVGDYSDAYQTWSVQTGGLTRRTETEIWFLAYYEIDSGAPDYNFESGYQIGIWTPDSTGRWWVGSRNPNPMLAGLSDG